MRKKAVFLVLALSLILPPLSNAEIVCESGHPFTGTDGVFRCNIGPPYGCLRCWDSITVGGGCSTPGGCVENPEP